jgi:phosphoribosylformylglycinamidine cyclo-ligase
VSAPERTTSPKTYAQSGVDRSAVGRALRALLRGTQYRPPPSHGRPVDAPGHYAGLLRIGRETIAVTTDTVGTKVMIAKQLRRFEEVGEDIVGVNVNDLAAVGARPAGLVDVISCAVPDPAVFAEIGRGIGRGLRVAECALLGGETAVVPDLVAGFDLGGTAFGFFPRGRRPVIGRGIRPGDVLLGIPSNGFHANGFTLVRRLLADHGVDLTRPRGTGKLPLGEELLRPTRIYSSASEALADRPDVRGFAHISGGGVRNLSRLHGDVAFVLDHWPRPEGLFSWVRDLGGLSDEEMYQTFNVGIGFVIVAAPHRLAELRRRLARAGAPDAIEVGHVERGTGVRIPSLGLEYPGYT